MGQNQQGTKCKASTPFLWGQDGITLLELTGDNVHGVLPARETHQP